jgi:uncharacterized membrane protein (UPF0182 family)
LSLPKTPSAGGSNRIGGATIGDGGRQPRPSLTELSHAVMLSSKPIPGHPGNIGSNRDGRDHLTQATGAVVGLIITAAVGAICLILLGLTGDFLVDWLWFSAIGYLDVFWTTVIAEAEVFFAVFMATAIILWVNGSLASRFARSPWTQRPADSEWKRTGVVTLPDLLEFMRHRLPWPRIIVGCAGLLAVLVAWAEVHNWGVFLRFFYQVPYGANDPLYEKDIGFYLFSLPAYLVIKNWMLLTLFLSALFAGAVYWVHGDIEFHAQRRSMSPIAIAHSSVLLGCFFAVKAWSYGLDRYLLLYGAPTGFPPRRRCSSSAAPSCSPSWSQDYS